MDDSIIYQTSQDYFHITTMKRLQKKKCFCDTQKKSNIMKAAKRKTKLFFMLPDDGSSNCMLYRWIDDIVSVMGS